MIAKEINYQMPVIHSNGTSAQELRDGNVLAYHAVNAALETIAKVEFNARDYYPVNGAWVKARDERDQHLNALRDAREYFMAVATHCDGFVK